MPRASRSSFVELSVRFQWPTRLLTLVAVGLCTLCGFITQAHAQVIEPVTDTAVDRTGTRRPDTKEPEAVTYADCVNDVVLTFDLNIRQLTGNDNLEVWAGSTNCAALTERRGDTARCWLVYQASPTDEEWQSTVRAQDLAAGADENEAFVPGQGTRDDCDANITDTSITLYFLMLGDNDEPITQTTWTRARLDLRGPAAPIDLQVGVGEKSLTLDWSTNSTNDRVGVSFFCDPVDGTETADAGVTACPSVLESGTLPSGGVLALGCGSTGANSTRGVASGLQDDQLYAVAVASTDLVDNFGLLSEVVCGIPEAVADFFELYRGAGGRGGGGYCSITWTTPTSGPMGLICSMGLLALAFRRRRVSRAPH